MPAFNLMPWRVQQQQRARWAALAVGLAWLVLVMVWWALQISGLQQQEAELRRSQLEIHRREPPLPQQLIWQAWQHESKLSLQEGALFWSALAELIPPRVYLQSVHWQADAVVLHGVAQQTDAMALMLRSITEQAQLKDPQWLSWEPDARSGTQFELALRWSSEASH